MSIRRLSSQRNRHEVVCHRQAGAHAAIVPGRSSAHTRGAHAGDFVIFADYPDGTKWSDIRGALDAKCGHEDAKPRVKPVEPTTVDLCGTAKDTYTIPAVRGVAYYVNGAQVAAGTSAASGTVRIVAKATKKGVVLAGNSSWKFHLGDSPCDMTTVHPAPPTIAPICGHNNDVVTAPTVVGLVYTVGAWVDNRLVVTVAATPGYAIAHTAKTTWVFTDDCSECPPTPPTPPTPAIATAPTVTPVCGADNDVVTVPTVAGVTYNVGTWSTNSLTVTATALPGHTLTGPPTTWTFTDAAEPCPVVSPPTSQVVMTKLGITKTVAGTSSAKKPVIFTITATNTGDAIATDVVIRDFLPVGMVFAGRPAGATLSKGVVTWRVGNLAPGASVRVKVALRLATNRTTRRCNTGTAVAGNAETVVAVGCTRFVRVAGVARLPVAG